jgi:hypothetical protein
MVLQAQLQHHRACAAGKAPASTTAAGAATGGTSEAADDSTSYTLKLDCEKEDAEAVLVLLRFLYGGGQLPDEARQKQRVGLLALKHGLLDVSEALLGSVGSGKQDVINHFQETGGDGHKRSKAGLRLERLLQVEHAPELEMKTDTADLHE